MGAHGAMHSAAWGCTGVHGARQPAAPAPPHTASSPDSLSIPTQLDSLLCSHRAQRTLPPNAHASPLPAASPHLLHIALPCPAPLQVRAATANAPGSTMVVVMNYRRTSSVLETVEGGTVASHLTRTCPVPLLVLEPALT